MQGDFTDFPLLHFLFQDYFIARGDVRDFMQRFLMILSPGIGVEGVFLIIECDAWADDIQYGNALMSKGGFQ